MMTMTRLRPLFLSLPVLALAGGCVPNHRSQRLHARFWVTPGAALRQEQPAAVPTSAAASPTGFATAVQRFNDFPESHLAGLSEKDNVGLAFSGGGNRAAVCALGQVRALQALGLMRRVRYLSVVSGGSWFSVPYTFQRGDDAAFLGPYVPPQALTTAVLKSPPPKGSFAHSAAHASTPVLPTVLSLHGDENFAYRLNNIYLRPFGLGNKNRFFCHDEATLAEILQLNSGLEKPLRREDFLVAAPGRPYLIANATLDIIGPSREKKFTPVEMTPNYTGAAAARKANHGSFRIGGGYVESYAYDSRYQAVEKPALGTEPGVVRVKLPAHWGLGALSSPRFSLSDVIASSGSAPTIPFPFVSYLAGFPQFQHWSPAAVPQTPGTGRVQTREKIHTDGGAVDNAGVIPLLRRRVGTIIAFVNDQNNPKLNPEDGRVHPLFPKFVGRLFGQKDGGMYSPCRVFDESRFAELEADYLAAWRADKPLIIQKRYTTVANPSFGIAQGVPVTVVWVFLGGSRGELPQGAPVPAGSLHDWLQHLPQDAQREMGSWTHNDFPYYKTFFENFPRIIKLPPSKVNALSQFTSFSVMSSASVFRRAFDQAR